MNLPVPPDRYDRKTEAARNSVLEQADARNRKKGEDIEVYPARLILRSPDGSRWEVTVDNAGVLSTTGI